MIRRPEFRAAAERWCRAVVCLAPVVVAFVIALAAPHCHASEATTDDAALAARLMENGQYAVALELLERLVLVNPNNAGAWLDMAVAYHHLGNGEMSTGLFDYVEQRFSPPPALRAVIEQYRHAAAPGLAIRPRWSAEIAILAGRETNINGAPVITSLDLTLGGSIVTLPLASSYRPQAAATALVEARAEGEQAVGSRGMRLLGYGELRAMQPDRATQYAVRQWQALGGLRGNGPAEGQWTLWLGAQQASMDGNTLLEANRLQLSADHPWGPCRVLVGVETEERRYPVQSVLDSRFSGALGGFSCRDDHRQFTANLRSGRDRPNDARPGGAQRRDEVTVAARWPQFRGSLELLASWSRARDGEAYSPLLGNAIRQLDRSFLRLEYAMPLWRSWDLLVRGERHRQRSNIDLFDISGDSLYVGLKHHF